MCDMYGPVTCRDSVGAYGQGGVMCQGGVGQGRQGGQGGVGSRQGGRGLPSHCSGGTHSVSCTKQCRALPNESKDNLKRLSIQCLPVVTGPG